ncbi:MAG: S41 family peptidase [Algoriphagus sp.]|uniref:S41 family peptidase n=1 Tax=Algoriphagus sp. TaxID=1872435 RepID=UPI002731DB4E|nr:S41 family peptidase [Algoriphagus sp.]MDP2042920.1 S41 family peptidase [Algoriphagus sp.]MDP3473417.1 S41 family peptidase [Algoriphagus sp.]
MKKLFTLILALETLLPFSHAQTLQPEHLKGDMEVFRDALERFHPEMYRYTDAASFEDIFSEIKSQLHQPRNQLEFYKTMLPAVAALKDGHLKWIIQGEDQHYGVFESDLFPLRLYFEAEKVSVLGHFSNESIPVLAEVVSINGRSIASIRASIWKNLTFGDGNSEGGKRYQLNRFFSAQFALEYGVSNLYEVALVHQGKSLIWTGKGVEKSQIEANYPSEDQPFSFRMTNGWTGIMKINRFFSYKHEPNFKQFLKNSFESLKDANISNLILDLRGNEGGFEKLGIELYRYLAQDKFEYYDFVKTSKNQKTPYPTQTSKVFRLLNSFSKEKNGKVHFTKAPGLKTYTPHKNRFDGNLIVLLDGQSFSVTTEFAARVQADGRAHLVGEETAGGAEVNSSGFFTIVTLPHSKIDLGIPRLGFHVANLNPAMPKDRGIIPEHLVSPTAEDIESGKDPIFEKALELVVRPNH